jgi:predicted nucleic acid-binding protein
VEEEGSEDVERAVAGSDRIATSAAAYPEARAAFARLEREGEISPEQHGAAVADLDADWPSFGVADLTRTFARFCGRTAARFGLRGYDAVHLASAVSVGLAAQLKHEEDVRRGSRRSISTPTTNAWREPRAGCCTSTSPVAAKNLPAAFRSSPHSL